MIMENKRTWTKLNCIYNCVESLITIDYNSGAIFKPFKFQVLSRQTWFQKLFTISLELLLNVNYHRRTLVFPADISYANVIPLLSMFTIRFAHSFDMFDFHCLSNLVKGINLLCKASICCVLLRKCPIYTSKSEWSMDPIKVSKIWVGMSTKKYTFRTIQNLISLAKRGL